MSNQEEASGQTQNMLERFYLLAGLGPSWYYPGGTGGGGWRGGVLGIPA